MQREGGVSDAERGQVKEPAKPCSFFQNLESLRFTSRLANAETRYHGDRQGP